MSGKLFKNGRIYTGEKFVNQMLVADGEVAWLGGEEAPPTGAFSEVVDLKGQTVLPSFWDVHTHPLWVADTLAGVACTPPLVNSISEMIAALKQAPTFGQTGKWIEGWGYDESKLAEGCTPTLADLDQVSTSQPVYVMRSDCHSCVVNSVALKMAGITAETPDPTGGEIKRFNNGEPNGVLMEFGASNIVKKVMEDSSFETTVAHALSLGVHYARRGISVISDLDSLLHPFDYAEVYSEACRRGLAQEVYLYYSFDELREYGRTALPQASHPQVHVAGVKLFMDGTISNQTAKVKRPFKNSEGTGFTINTKADLLAAYEFAKANHCQIAIHAMGDATIQLVLDTLGAKEPWLADRPSVRIEHATLLSDEMLRAFSQAKMNFAFVTQIIFFFAEYASYAQNLEDARLKECYRVKSMLNSGVATALSSDAPATAWYQPDDVFASLRAAVSRLGANGENLYVEEAVDLKTALSLYFERAAAIVGRPASDAQLKIGSPANFNILSGDIFTLPPEKYTEITIDQTWLQGKKVK